jgi:hypothetical protein
LSAPDRGARVLYAFDLLELNGADLRREPIEVPQGDTGKHPSQKPGTASA